MEDLLQRYFGTQDLAEVDPAALPAGVERMRVDFGLERDRGHRFALWTLLRLGSGAIASDGSWSSRSASYALAPSAICGS